MKRFSGALLVGAILVSTGNAASPPPATPDDVITQRVQALLNDATVTWSQQFAAIGSQYPPAFVGYFRQTAIKVCASDAPLTGPFYCPGERRIYLDRAFLDRINAQAPGAADGALAYVIGHELGHHVQALLGTSTLVAQARSSSSPAVAARTWMAAELQADCYAGIWLGPALTRGAIHSTADTPAIMAAVTVVSQANINQPAGAPQSPDPLLTYGTPALRLKWFQRGAAGGKIDQCDTFGALAAGTL